MINAKFKPTSENEIVIQLRDRRADAMGRRKFIAHWLTAVDGTGRAYDHRGQAFFTNIADFRADANKRGLSVRIGVSTETLRG